MEKLLELSIKSVRMKIAEPPEIDNKAAGEYSFFSHVIKIRKEIVPYWFATLTTLLHELGHHRQRHLIYTITTLSVIIGAGIIFTDYLIPFDVHIYLSVFVMSPLLLFAAFLKVFHLEHDADRFMVRKIPDNIIILLSQLEIVEVA